MSTSPTTAGDADRATSPLDTRTRLALSVRDMAPGEEAVVVAILVDAFDRDPLAHWLYPNADERRANHEKIFGEVVRTPPPGTLIEVTSDLGTVAIWYPPGTTGGRNDDPSGTTGGNDDPSGPTPDAAALFAAIDAATPPQPFWNLAFLGARVRGAGGGSALLRHRLSALGDVPSALWTGNEANLAFYARFGFVPVSRHDVPRASAWWLTGGRGRRA